MPRRKVHVAEIATNRVVHSEVITLGSLNSETTKREFEDIAWRNAVADGDVPTNSDRAKYKFVIESA